MADRYTYVPIIGLFIIFAWGVSDMLSGWRYKRISLAISALLVLSAFMFCTWRQVRNWQNSITLFENAIHVTPNNYVAHHKLGEALVIHGKNNEAIKHYLEALRIKPDFIPAHLNMAAVLSDMGKVNKAIDQFAAILNFKPDCAEAHFELGVSFKKKGDIEAALQHFYEALRLKPEDARTHNNLGVVHVYHNNIKKAIFHFYEAIRIDSSYAGAYYNLGKIFYDQGNTRKAILFYQKALDFNPDMIQALYNLSLIFSCIKEQKYRDSEKAMNMAEKLCKINQYNEPLSLDALAAAYAEEGRFDDAVSTVEKALNLAIHNGPESLVSDLKKRLQLYRKGEACR
jgi:tetratricopeptide (TPR) repeat protein